MVLLENLRFHAEEEQNDEQFARGLARLADVYVNDAFGTAHRAHASTVGMVRFVPERAAGFLLQRECEYLGKVLTAPERPLVAILGGAKVSDKIKVIRSLLDRSTRCWSAGPWPTRFCAPRDARRGSRSSRRSRLRLAGELLRSARERKVDLVLPVDHVVADEARAGAPTATVRDIPAGKIGLDIGPATLERFRAVIATARTIFWNGPLGMFEVAPFDTGTMAIAAAVADSGATSIVGGGDSVAAVMRSGRADAITHISTGGGASLEFLEGKPLPGLSGSRSRIMSPRVPLLAGNWKMHGTVPEAVQLATAVVGAVRDVADREVLVAPPFPSLAAVAESLKGSRVLLAGQNLHWEDKGAFTGEVSGPMLVAVGCTHVIVGHSERRQLFGDTDEWVARKVAAALRSGLTPIVCVGETLQEREANETFGVIDRQVRAALFGLDATAIVRLILAYEPIWAIGTGKVATPEQAQEVHGSIRALLTELAEPAVAAQVRILYGGSVKPDNIDALMRQADLDGALVGGASLNAADFARIVRFTA